MPTLYDFEMKTIDGNAIDLGRLYGRQAVYLKFWATWCVPCRQQMPHFQHAFETAGPGMEVIAVNTGFNDSLDTVRTYRKRLGITMPIVIDDGSLAAAFGLRVTPQHIVIGRDGRILYVGHLADARLDAALCGLFLLLVTTIVADSIRVWIAILRGTREAHVRETPFVLSRLRAEEL